MLLAPVRLKNLIFLTGGRMFMRKLCYFRSKGFEHAGSGSCAPLDRPANYVNGDERRFISFYGNRSVFAYLNLNDCG